jgi:ribonuclease E
MPDVLESGATGAAPEPEPSGTDAEALVPEVVDDEPTIRSAAAKRRRRGTRGGRGRNRTRVPGTGPDDDADIDDDQPELPDRPIEGKIQSPEVAERVLVRRPQIGDTRPAPAPEPQEPPAKEGKPAALGPRKRRRAAGAGRTGTGSGRAPARAVVTPASVIAPVELDEETLERRRGRERKGRPVGRYLMSVHVTPELTQIAVLEGRSLIEHYVSRPSDDVSQIHGNVYLGRVQNVLPGMEAAFVDIGTPKNAVLYRGDVQYEAEDIVERSERPRIEQMLKARQMILCQVTKNPIGAKGARLTQEVSLPGRFVVLIPNSRTYGISKRLPDDERKRLRSILDNIKPTEHGVIVRTAAENVMEEELQNDVLRLLRQWEAIEEAARKANSPALLYREPDMAVRVIREEFNREYRGVLIDDRDMFEDVYDYVTSIMPALADRVEYYDATEDGLPLFERFHIHEQIHKALDRKVWLPSGGSLIIEHTEALTVIDVNTGKNVGTSNLEATVFHNNLEAAEEIARQLRLRDIGGIIVIDFIDMEIRDNRQAVVAAFKEALARDKTRTQVFDISELGLVEMTRKRIGEGLLTSFAQACPVCEGRGLVVDHSIIE